MLWKNSALNTNDCRFIRLQSGSWEDLRVNNWRRVILKRGLGWWGGFWNGICFLLLLNELLHYFKVHSASLGPLTLNLVNDLFVFVVEGRDLEWRDWSISILNWIVISSGCLLLILNDRDYEEIWIILRLLLWFWILSLDIIITYRSIIEVVYIIAGSVWCELRLDRNLGYL